MTNAEEKIFQLVRAELVEELLPKKYRDRKVDNKYYGHCHHAAVAMYNLLGGMSEGYCVRKATDELGITHYWLETRNGEIIDPTAEQYTDLNRTLPYERKINNRASYRKTRSAMQIIDNVNNLI